MIQNGQFCKVRAVFQNRDHRRYRADDHDFETEVSQYEYNQKGCIHLVRLLFQNHQRGSADDHDSETHPLTSTSGPFGS